VIKGPLRKAPSLRNVVKAVPAIGRIATNKFGIALIVGIASATAVSAKGLLTSPPPREVGASVSGAVPTIYRPASATASEPIPTVYRSGSCATSVADSAPLACCASLVAAESDNAAACCSSAQKAIELVTPWLLAILGGMGALLLAAAGVLYTIVSSRLRREALSHANYSAGIAMLNIAFELWRLSRSLRKGGASDPPSDEVIQNILEGRVDEEVESNVRAHLRAACNLLESGLHRIAKSPKRLRLKVEPLLKNSYAYMLAEQGEHQHRRRALEDSRDAYEQHKRLLTEEQDAVFDTYVFVRARWGVEVDQALRALRSWESWAADRFLPWVRAYRHRLEDFAERDAPRPETESNPTTS